MLNSCFSSVFEETLEVVSITCSAVDGIEKLPSVTVEEGRQHMLENLHLKVITKSAKIFEGKFLAKRGKLEEFLRI